MTQVVTTIVRPFDGSLADAEGLLAVERETFNECPYTPEQLGTMLTAGRQRAWLALAGEQVAGFVAAFATHGLRGPSWEIDLLAVHPDWGGRGLGTRLIRAAAAGGARIAARARAVVAADNRASARAFARAGFESSLACRLLLYRPQLQGPPASRAAEARVRPAQGIGELAPWLPDPLPPDRPPPGGERPGVSLLVALAAEGEERPAGYAELIEVQTLLYHGVWIESLAARTGTARAALVHDIVNRGFEAGLDEVGAMVPEDDEPWQEALLAQGFRSLGGFYWLEARLPLPGLASGDGRKPPIGGLRPEACGTGAELAGGGEDFV